jgi:hypothetical protein
MTTATKKTSLAEFSVESLGIDSPSYFPGYGVSFSDYEFCTYGIGDTEAEALEDCLECMASAAGFDWSDAIESRIRAEFGACDDSTTVAEELGLEEDYDDCGEGNYFHVGIKWNEKEVG